MDDAMVQRPEPTEPDDPQVLAEHGRFVRNLAWRLLHDEDAAEEVVQETMLAAVQAKPDTGRSLRPWLATVARNVIRRRFRSRKRVRRREEAAAKPEAVPSAFDMAARAEMLREVVDAVLCLDEPNRSTVLLRFYEDLPPREIAAQQGVGVETVRGRIKRAIQQLRRRLDRRHGGPRGWAPLLGALTGLEVPAELLGTGAGAAAGGTAVGETAPAAASSAAGALKGVAAAFLLGAAVCASAVVATTSPPTGATRASTLPSGRGLPVRVDGAPATGPSATDGPPREAEDRFTTASRRNRELVWQVLRLRGRIEALQTTPSDPEAFRVGVAAVAPRFDTVDWGAIAKHVRAMSEFLVEIKKIVEGGGEPTLAQQSKLLEHNTPVSTFAVTIGPELDAPNANLAFTHPTVVANLVRATLVLLEDPLSREQTVALRTLAEVWALEAQAMRTRLAADAPYLEGVLLDLEARMRFQAALKDVLTASQRAKLYSPETEGRVDLDMLSPGLLFPRLLRHHVSAMTRERLEQGLVIGLFTVAGLEVEDLGPYEWIGREWVAAIPEVLEARFWYDPDSHFPTTDTMQRWLTQQVEAIRRVIAVGLLTPEEAQNLREVAHVLRPRIQPQAARSDEAAEDECCPDDGDEGD